MARERITCRVKRPVWRTPRASNGSSCLANWGRGQLRAKRSPELLPPSNRDPKVPRQSEQSESMRNHEGRINSVGEGKAGATAKSMISGRHNNSLITAPLGTSKGKIGFFNARTPEQVGRKSPTQTIPSTL